MPTLRIAWKNRDDWPHIAEVASGNVVESIYQHPPAEPGAVEDALSNTLVSELDLAPTPKADRVLPAG